MSAGRRVGGRFVTHSEAEIYHRALVAPAVNWKREWSTPAGLPAESKYKVRKWVKSNVPQEFSDESDQEDDGELYANNSAPTMELPPKPVVPGAPTPVPDVAVADALASEEPAAQEVLDTSSLPPTDEPQASLPESEMKSDDDALPAAAAPTAAPPLVSSDSAPQPSNVDSVAGEPSTTAASLAPPPSAPQPSSPLSPAASSPLSIAPSPFPTASTPAASTQAEEKQDDPSPVPGQAHPLPGVEGEMALTGEDGSDPRSAGAQIGMGVPALEDQPMDDA